MTKASNLNLQKVSVSAPGRIRTCAHGLGKCKSFASDNAVALVVAGKCLFVNENCP
jgi:hypothetical protein